MQYFSTMIPNDFTVFIIPNRCPTPGCNGSGHINKNRNSHRSVSGCPLASAKARYQARNNNLEDRTYSSESDGSSTNPTPTPTNGVNHNLVNDHMLRPMCYVKHLGEPGHTGQANLATPRTNLSKELEKYSKPQINCDANLATVFSSTRPSILGKSRSQPSTNTLSVQLAGTANNFSSHISSQDNSNTSNVNSDNSSHPSPSISPGPSDRLSLLVPKTEHQFRQSANKSPSKRRKSRLIHREDTTKHDILSGNEFILDTDLNNLSSNQSDSTSKRCPETNDSSSKRAKRINSSASGGNRLSSDRARSRPVISTDSDGNLSDTDSYSPSNKLGRDGRELLRCPHPDCNGMGHVSGYYATHRSLSGCPLADRAQVLANHQELRCPTENCDGSGHITGVYSSHRSLSGCPRAKQNARLASPNKKPSSAPISPVGGKSKLHLSKRFDDLTNTLDPRFSSSPNHRYDPADTSDTDDLTTILQRNNRLRKDLTLYESEVEKFDALLVQLDSEQQVLAEKSMQVQKFYKELRDKFLEATDKSDPKLVLEPYKDKEELLDMSLSRINAICSNIKESEDNEQMYLSLKKILSQFSLPES